MKRKSRVISSLSGIAGAVGLIAVITLLARAVGFFRWWALTSFVGTETLANSYVSANQLPNVLFEIAAGGALAGITIPLLAGPIAKGLKNEVSQTSSALLTWCFTLLIPAGILLYLFADPIAVILPQTAGADPLLQDKLTAEFIRIFAPQVPLYGLCVVASGILQSHQRFFWPALAPLLSSLVVITTYSIFGLLAPVPDQADASLRALLAWGTTAGVAALSIPLLLPIQRQGVRLYVTWKLPDGQGIRALRLGVAGIVTVLAQQGAVLVSLTLVRSWGALSSIVALQNALVVYYLPYAVLAVPVSTAVFPRIAAAVEARKDILTAQIIATSTRAVFLVSLVSMILLCGIAPAAQALFSLRHPVTGMGIGLAAMAPGIVGYSLLYHLQRCLYALDAGRAVVRATVMGWVSAALGQIVAVYLLVEVSGDGPSTLLAVSSGQAIGMTIIGLALVKATAKITGKEVLFRLRTPFLVGLPVATVLGAFGYFLGSYTVGDGAFVEVIISAICGASPGLAALIIFVVILKFVSARQNMPLTDTLLFRDKSDEPASW